MKFSCPTDFLRNAQWLKPLEMPPKREVLLTSFAQKMVGFGSCFAQNLKSVLDNYYFPFWFNRDSCAHYTTDTLLQTLRRASGIEEHREDEIVHVHGDSNDIVLINYFKTRFYGPDALENARKARTTLDAELVANVKDADVFIITLGNSRVFVPNNRKTTACNIYGLGVEDFTAYQQTPAEVERDLREIRDILLRIRAGRPLTLILTVSPQRYFYDPSTVERSTLENNCLMKATLRVAVDSFVRAHPNEGVHYFPAFEMVIDELRLHETLSTYDHLHINQDFTPRYVVKRFLKFHASDGVLANLPLVEARRELIEETKLAFSRGATPTHPEILAGWRTFFEGLVAASEETTHAFLWKLTLEAARDLKMLDHVAPELRSDALSPDVQRMLESFLPADALPTP
jgi:hypothetical protein